MLRCISCPAQIVQLQVESIAGMLKENGVTLQITPAAVAHIAAEGFDPQFGARPIKRALQRLVLNQLSEQIIARTIQKDKPIVVDAVGGSLVFNNG